MNADAGGHSIPSIDQSAETGADLTASVPSRELVRSGLIARCMADSSPVLVVAPAGYGKTTFCRQLSRAHQSARWIDCSDEANSLEDLFSDAGHADALIVDGCDFALHDLRQLRNLALSLEQRNQRLILTAPAIPEGRLAPFRNFTIIDADDLLFSKQEATAIAGGLGADTLEHTFSRCGGHPALYTALIASPADTKEIDGGRAGRMRISGWVEYIVSTLRDELVDVLFCASLIGSGTLADLHAVGVGARTEDMQELAVSLPLVTWKRSGRSASFKVDELVLRYGFSRPEVLASRHGELMEAVGRLAATGRLDRAAEIVGYLGDQDETMVFLRGHGEAMLKEGLLERLAGMLDEVPLQQLVSDSGMLLLWAGLEAESCRDGEALAKARAASVVAAHHSNALDDLRARLITLDSLRNLGRWHEAAALAENLPASGLEGEERSVASQIRLASASLRLVMGDIDAARRLMDEVHEVRDHQVDRDNYAKCTELEGVLMVLQHGDSFGATRHWSPLLLEDGIRRGRRVQTMLNMGVCLVEVGRIDRAVTLLECVLASGEEWFTAHALPPLACAKCARADDPTVIDLFEDAIQAATRSDEPAAAQVRVYQSAVLRSFGRADEALMSAERAYETLALRNVMNFRRLAALEVAASLLALGDVAAARSWAEPVVSDGFGKNQHHALRAAMILSECDRRDGAIVAAISRLKPFAEHVASENSNWQAAMYVRAFPELLGMFAEAYGVAALPSHMLRMVLPQYAERSLRLSKEFMDPARWQELGLRVLGETQFQQMLERNGEPICHVRVFGTLEVSVDGRSVQERDWRKRKARLLFAMLAVRRGADTPRDELLEHLWPEMDEDRAKNNFYVAWSAMKGALMGGSQRATPSPYIESARGRCRIVPEAVRLDLDDFDEALVAARDAESAGKPRAAISAYESISTTYRGDLLPGDVYDDWFSPLRDHYRMQFISAMTRATELLLEEDDPCEALLFVRRGLSVDPLREDLYQLALRCHILAGQRSAAIDTFIQCRSNLGEELGLDPSGETMKLYQEVLSMEECPRTDTYGLS